MKSSRLTRWITILLLICLPLQNYATGVGTLCLCQNSPEDHTIPQHLLSQSESNHHHTNTDHSPHHLPTPAMDDSGGCSHCGMCTCCGIPTSILPFLPKLENTFLVSFAILLYQFILEPPQHPPRLSHV